MPLSVMIPPRLLAPLAGLGLVIGACTGGGDGPRVTIEELRDFEQPLPEDATGVDLAEFAPDAEVAFCDAAAAAPSRWIIDALIPVQFWHDTFDAVGDAPAEIQPSIDRLVAFAEARQRWSLGGGGARPELDETLDADMVALAESAVTTCRDLPLVVGPPGISDAPAWWSDLSGDEVAAQCRDIADRQASAVEQYVDEVGRQPRHQIEVEAVLPYTASDFHGVTLDENGLGVVIPVPGSACDLG